MKQEAPRWEALGDGCGLWVTAESAVTTDSLLLAHFCLAPLEARKAPFCAREHWADLGTGTGLLPILWRQRGFGGKITAVELRAGLAALARRSAEANRFREDFTVLCADAAQARTIFAPGSLHLLASNPPYYPPDRGAVAEGVRGLSRQEGSLSLETLAEAGRWALRDGGRLCVCLAPFRLGEAVRVFSAKGLEPKRLRLAQGRADTPPFLALLECRKGGRTGLLTEPVLVLQTASGEMTEAGKRAYGAYLPAHDRKEG